MTEPPSPANQPTVPTQTGRDAKRADPPRNDRTGPSRWPLWLALVCITLVWLGGAFWSYEEQTAFAQSKGFHLPWLLPLVIDGFGVAMAAVAFAASLDGRAAVFARLGTAVAIACSASSNAAWAWERSAADPGTVALAAAVPVVANIAFEVLLSESRKQVQRHRGLPAPIPIPSLRLIGVALSPIARLKLWRRLVLEATDPRHAFDAVRVKSQPVQPQSLPVTLPPVPPRLPVLPVPMAQPAPVQASPVQPTNVRPIRPAVPPTQSARTRPSGPGPQAVRDAEVLLVRYGNQTPGRNQIMREMGWGGPKASNALGELPAVRRAAREANRSTDDDQERQPVLAGVGG